MKVSRRSRRRLLLPPGWVALGFLLLLGCQALGPWEKQLKLRSVLQVTMPPLQPDTSYVHFMEKHAPRPLPTAYNPYSTPWSKDVGDILQGMRPWHNVEFRGSYLPDFLSAATTEAAIRYINADTSHAGGVRIRFLSGATYANLVKALDVMYYTGHKKYWLDIRQYPTTLYAITDQRAPSKPVPTFSCGTRHLEPYSSPKKIGLQGELAEFWENSLLLAKHPWQASSLWLAIISSLSLGQLIRPKASCNRF
jgi:hypothetical protein